MGTGIASGAMIGIAAPPIVHVGNDAAAWAAAIGTFLAAVAAVGIAAVTNHRDARRERRRDLYAEIDRQMTDLDETRRLLFVAWFQPSAVADPMLFSTITHALAKHSGLMDAERAAQMLTRRARDNSEEQDVRDLVDQIDARLDDLRTQRQAINPALAPGVLPWHRRLLHRRPRSN